MPINVERLQSAAAQAWANYPSNVPTGKFVGAFETWCVDELRYAGLPPPDITVSRPGLHRKIGFELSQNVYVLGGYDRKELDVSLQSSTSGPLLGISLKASMSSIGKNVNNRWEEMVGDAANLHSRFPALSFGFLMILPATSTTGETIVNSEGSPSELTSIIARKLRAIHGRTSSTELISEYEEAALCIIDFDKNPPELCLDFPGSDSRLRINDFFDRLIDSYSRRNPYF